MHIVIGWAGPMLPISSQSRLPYSPMWTLSSQALLMTSNLRTGYSHWGSIINYLAGKKRPDTIIATATMDIRVVFLS